MNNLLAKKKPLFLLFAFWVLMLSVFWLSSGTLHALPPIAVQGLSDVWLFYLPLFVFTLITVFFFTRNRTRPDWESFSICRATLKRDLLLAIGYLVACHLFLGVVLDTGLHFPGPEVFTPSDHGVDDVARWAFLQGLFFILLPYFWLRRQGFKIRKLVSDIHWRKDIWLIIAFWLGEFLSVAFISGFFQVAPASYLYAIPLGVLVNTIGAGLPVLIMVHIIIIPRLSIVFNNQLLVIAIAGLLYASFSLFDPGVSYANTAVGMTSFSYIMATQMLIGMGKATFTVRTGNPFIHFSSYHILGARVAFDTAMYAVIFKP